MTVVAAPDTTDPTVALGGPETVAPGASLVLSATAADNVGIASVRFFVDATAISTDTSTPYSASYAVPAGTPVGSLLVFSARATDFSGNTADAATTIAVVTAPDTTPPAITLAAPPTVPEGATFEVAATATDAGGIAQVAFAIDDVPTTIVGTAPFTARVSVPSTRGAGSVLTLTATATDRAALTAVASATTLVVGDTAGTGLLTGEVYDDATGLPVAGASVRASVNGVERTTLTDARGRYGVSLAAGLVRVVIAKRGYTSVERSATVVDRGVAEIIDARVTPLGPVDVDRGHAGW